MSTETIESPPLTVKDLRDALEGLPDSLVVRVANLGIVVKIKPVLPSHCLYLEVEAPEEWKINKEWTLEYFRHMLGDLTRRVKALENETGDNK
jgi:hypothetical protein